MVFFLFFCIPLCIGIGGIIFLAKQLYQIQTQSKSVPTIETTVSGDSSSIPKQLNNDIEFVPRIKKEDILFLSKLIDKNEYASPVSLLSPVIENTLTHNNGEKAYIPKHFIDDKGNTIEITDLISRIKTQKTAHGATMVISEKIEHHKHIFDNEVITNGTEFSN